MLLNDGKIASLSKVDEFFTERANELERIRNTI